MLVGTSSWWTAFGWGDHSVAGYDKYWQVTLGEETITRLRDDYTNGTLRIFRLAGNEGGTLRVISPLGMGGNPITNVARFGTASNYVNVGKGNTVGTNNTVGIGVGVKATSGHAVAIGDEASVEGATELGVAIGFRAIGDHGGSSIGALSRADYSGVAVGVSANGYSAGMALGSFADGRTRGVGIGYNANGSQWGLAIGRGSWGSGTNIALGYGACASNGGYRISVGYQATNLTDNSILVRGTPFFDGATGMYYRTAFGAGAWLSLTNLEADPHWGAVSNAISTQAANGATAYGWGDHGTNDYISLVTKTNTTITSGAAVTLTNTLFQTCYVTNAIAAMVWDGWMSVQYPITIDFFNAASNAVAFPTNWTWRVDQPTSGAWTNGTVSVYPGTSAGTDFAIGDFQ